LGNSIKQELLKLKIAIQTDIQADASLCTYKVMVTTLDKNLGK
jgi:hypothetical protein